MKKVILGLFLATTMISFANATNNDLDVQTDASDTYTIEIIELDVYQCTVHFRRDGLIVATGTAATCARAREIAMNQLQ